MNAPPPETRAAPSVAPTAPGALPDLLDPLVADAPVGFGLLDHDLRYRYVNETLAALNLQPAAWHRGRYIGDVLSPTLWGLVEGAFRRALGGETTRDWEVAGEYETEDGPGGRHYFLLSVYPLHDEGGDESDGDDAVSGVGFVVSDITGRKRAEALTAAQNRVLRRVAGGAPLAESLGELTRLFEEQCPGTVCTVLLYEAETGTLRLGAGPGLSESYREALGQGFVAGPDIGTCSRAAYHGREAVTEDIAAHTDWGPARDYPLADGLRACWSTPILGDGGAVLGTFGVFYRQARRPNARERSLIGDAVHTARIAIERDQTDRRRRLLLRDMMGSLTEGRLRLCLAPGDLPATLPELCATVDLLPRSGLRELRAAALAACEMIGLTGERADDYVTAVHEAGMNAVVHAKGLGMATITYDPAAGVVQAWVTDAGGGIPEESLHRAVLERGFTTARGFGHGFWLMLRCCDRVWLHTAPDGTTLALEQARVAPAPGWLAER